ncbi:MAG: SDR family oxidoreductase [Ktedonobacterales bacterium]|nr:SDR family oxidoreductase [Ktedonobacterales bacterium]
MAGKVCLATGATNGIGKVTATALANQGATLVIVGRDATKVAETVRDITAQTGNTHVESIVADLSSQAEVRRTAQEFLAKHDRLDVLFNNAGAAFTKRQESVDGLEMTFALNHMAYFTLTQALLPTIQATDAARIVCTASEAHRGAHIDFADLQSTRRFQGFGAYGRSKLMNIMFGYELARRLSGTGITVNTLHPGFVATGFAKNNGGLIAFAVGVLLRPVEISPAKGAETPIYLATSPEVRGVTGKYFSKRRAISSSKESYVEADQARLWAMSEEIAARLGAPLSAAR